MRWFALLLVFLGLVEPLSAETRVSVNQLEEFLLSRHASKESDAELAYQLSSIQLSEQLSDSRLAEISAKVSVGPETAVQLKLLAISSVFEAPPSSEVPLGLSPDSLEQQRLIGLARVYASALVQHLPDFTAFRTTQAFNNSAQFTAKRHSKPEIEMHFVREFHREVAFRAGQEVLDSQGGGSIAGAPRPIAPEGLTTWGEFGPILTTVLGDSLKGTIVWSRWQSGAEGRRLAVFHYSIPKPASHYLIDLGYYLTSQEDHQFLSFRDKPGYSGDLYIDPSSGTILRITLDAELGEDAPVKVSKLSVQYEKVEIGGKTYICPTQGVAQGIAYNLQMEEVDGVGLEKFINVVHFTNYHKFGSTSRIVNNN